ncbi:MAG TPA: hypothetical protein DCO90_18965, partial [Sphingobacterium sp.]|nr:hypothetical protein [Sphingobacterium sp.]
QQIGSIINLAHNRVKKCKNEIALALTGDWREEYIFELKQSYELYQYLQKKIQECDVEIKNNLNKESRKMREKMAKRDLTTLLLKS